MGNRAIKNRVRRGMPVVLDRIFYPDLIFISFSPIAKMKERIRYEEENFMRLPLSKKEKHKRGQMTTIGSLGDEITYFGNDNFYNDPKSKKRKSGGGGDSRKFKKGSGGKKFKKH